MYVIGLTGGIGSGKTAVAEMLRELGAALVQADPVAYEVYAAGTPGWQEVVDAFGRDVVATDGSIDRRKLGAIVFADPEARQRLNAITHPRMKELMRERLAALDAAGTRVTVLEAALLLDAGWDDLTDEVWALSVPAEVAARRTAERMGISVEEARARMKAQLPEEERLKRADVLIDNGGSLEETRAQVAREWSRLQERIGSPSASGDVR
ncbi:MAG: dephospho-CoA kinase [Chloroflexi bacterium]|nr:dephospho-CoA kinase [Chloroflexota bacterium]